MPANPHLTITRRNLPHWKLEGSVYFVTFRLLRGKLTEPERAVVLEHLRSGDPQFYTLCAAVVMPDYVHLLIKPNPGFDLSRVMKGIKGVSARKLNEHRGTRGPIWQDESHDRIMRNEREFLQKLEYMANNPAAVGLITGDQVWDGWYLNADACFGQTGMSAPLEA